MSLTAWKTYASGDNATAADRNTYERDNGKWLTHDGTDGAPMCVVRRTTQDIANASEQGIGYTEADLVDVGDMHETISQPTRITVPTGGGGQYLCGFEIKFEPNSTGFRQMSIKDSGGSTFGHQRNFSPSSSQNTNMTTSFLLHDRAAAGYWEYIGYQTSGGLLDACIAICRGWAIWMGE